MRMPLPLEISPALKELNKQLDRDPRAFILVVSGPSGVGKSSICEGVLAQEQQVQPCVTTTTRVQRPGEVDGVDYHFVSDEVFGGKLTRGEFIEHAEVYGFRYGATVDAVSAALAKDQVMLLDVYVHGAEKWKADFGDRCVTAFLLPPSLQALKKRLEGRKTEAGAVLRRSMRNFQKELDRAPSYDYLIVNHSLEKAIRELQTIIRAEKCRPRRMSGVLAGLDVSGGADDTT